MLLLEIRPSNININTIILAPQKMPLTILKFSLLLELRLSNTSIKSIFPKKIKIEKKIMLRQSNISFFLGDELECHYFHINQNINISINEIKYFLSEASQGVGQNFYFFMLKKRTFKQKSKIFILMKL